MPPERRHTVFPLMPAVSPPGPGSFANDAKAEGIRAWLKCVFGCRHGMVVVRTDVQAVITAEYTVSNIRVIRLRDGATVFDGEIRDAFRGVEDVGFRNRVIYRENDVKYRACFRPRNDGMGSALRGVIRRPCTNRTRAARRYLPSGRHRTRAVREPAADRRRGRGS